MKPGEFRNFFWLCLDALTAILTALVIGGQVARHLGSAGFGDLAYEWALVLIAGQFGSLGLDLVVFREVARQPANARRLLARCLRLRLAGGATIFIFGAAFLPLSNAGIIVLALTCFLSIPCELFFIYFSARLNSNRVFAIRAATRLLGGAARLGLIHMGAGLSAFLISNGIEGALAGLIAAGIGTLALKKEASGSSEQIPSSLALLRESLPLTALTLANAAYSRLDLVMLKNLADPISTGNYAVATRFITAPLFLPLALASSFMPRLTRLFEESRERYRATLLQLLRWNALAAYLLIGLIMLPLFDWCVNALFGGEFSTSIPLAQLLALSWIFRFTGIVRSHHLRIERTNRLLLLSATTGIVVNLGLNLALIPPYGATGAAVATTLALFVSTILTSFISARHRWLGQNQLLALVSPIPRP